ncbi:MAG: cation:proton antiporter [Candidatus Sumerlaeia bacterium]|nr:cation:proton antiporter [Candidatus Sumerlaeia bacterium]
MEIWGFIQDIVVLLGAALVLGAIFERLGQSAILGYLLAGALLSTGALGILQDEAGLRTLSELGVALLLFTIGLEFSVRRLFSMGFSAVFAGTGQTAFTVFLFTIAALGFGFSLPTALALGILAGPSSTACVLRLLRERSEMDSPHGRGAVGVLLFQDLALVPLVIVMSALGGGGGEESAGIFQQTLVAVGLLLLLCGLFYLASIFLVPKAFDSAAMLKNREILILLAISTALGAMWLANRFDTSPALGAFIAGMLLAESPFAAQMRSDISTLRTLFVTIFFASVGMMADLTWIFTHLGGVLLLLALIIIGKAFAVWVILRILKYTHRAALAAGICVSQIGEFSFVLAEIGRAGGVIDEDSYRIVVSAALGSLFATPFLVAGALYIGSAGQWLMERLGLARPEALVSSVKIPKLNEHVVLVGHGPAGRGVSDVLARRKIPFVILDLNPASVRLARTEGYLAELGDATQEDILEHLQIGTARAIVITIPDHHAIISIIELVHSIAPETAIIVRARHHMHVADYERAGAHFVVDEEINVGHFLGNRVAKVLTGAVSD